MVNIWHKNWIANKNGQIWNIGSHICAIFFEALPLLLRTNKRLFVCLFAYNGQFSHLSNFFLSVTWPFHLLLLLRYSLHFDTFLRDRSFWSKTDSSTAPLGWLKAWRRRSTNFLLTKLNGANVHHYVANLSYTMSAPEDGSVVWFHQTNILAGRSTTFVIWGLNFKLYESGIQ